MDYTNNVCEWKYAKQDVAQEFKFFNVLKDGRIHVLATPGPNKIKIPPSDDQVTGVRIKDVKISSDVVVRMFLPHNNPSGKLPVLIYAHGGAFCMSSAFSVEYTRLLTNYVAQCNIIAVSVEYRLFPAHPSSVCYNDCWDALHWVASHSDDPVSGFFKLGTVIEPWISEYADLKRIFIGGDSSGATISHTLMTNVRKIGLRGDAKVEGMILVHPYFGENDEMWMYMCPVNEGPKDPRMKAAAVDLAELRCERVLVVVAEDDFLKVVGVEYAEELKKNGWNGKVEVLVNKNKEHCFHLSDYMDDQAIVITHRIKSLIHNEI